MEDATRQLIQALHRGPYRYVLAVTGGGTQAVAALLNVPGGSRTILEALVPYDAGALADFLGYSPEQSCTAESSRVMARRAFERARRLAPLAAVAGLGCTAGLVSDKPKRGEHRFHLSLHTANGSTTWSLTLSKGSRDRAGEEAVLDIVLLNALADTFGVPLRLPNTLLPGEVVHVETLPASAVLGRLFRGDCPAVCADVDGRLNSDAAPPAVLLPGSFNPLHDGHLRMAEVAERMVQAPVAFELSVENVDKPSLTVADVCRRLRRFAWRAPVWLTRAPRFVQKAALFPRAAFIVGVDTAERLVAPAYYGGSEEQMRQALGAIGASGCRFLVAGRLGKNGAFQSLCHVGIPAEYRDLFCDIPETDFRLDISSTVLRATV